LNVYSTATCLVGPATVTTTSRITNTAYATSSQAQSLTSTASYGSRDPSAVELSRFDVRVPSADWVLLAMGVAGVIVLAGLALARRKS